MAFPRWFRLLLPTMLLAWASLSAAAPSAEEHVVIQTLIQRVEKMTNMTFVRNGEAHTSAEAAAHMQAKYTYFKDKIKTAEDFIELCASRSAMTGKAYWVKLGEAAPVEANAFLKKELSALRGAPPS